MQQPPPLPVSEPMMLDYAPQSDWSQSLRPLVWLAMALAIGRVFASLIDAVATAGGVMVLAANSNPLSPLTVIVSVLTAMCQGGAAVSCYQALRGNLRALHRIALLNLATVVICVIAGAVLCTSQLQRAFEIPGASSIRNYYFIQSVRVGLINLAMAGMFLATWFVFRRQARVFGSLGNEGYQ